MVLEGLAAVGAAAAVVQFVGYGYKVVSKGNELYHSANGTLEDNAFLELVIKDFKVVLDRINQSTKQTSQAIQDFRDEGLKLAGEMLDGLEKLKVKGPPGKWKSLRKALKAVHTKKKIDSWTERLNILRDQFNTHVGVDILERFELFELSFSKEFQQLDVQQQKRLQVFMDGLLDALRQEIDFFQKSMIQQLDEIKDSNRLEHAITRTQLSTNHRKTIETIKTEHKASHLLTSKEAAGTRDHVSLEHDETRERVSVGNRELHGLITSTQAQTARDAEQQHTGTRNVVMDTIVQQNTSTEQSLKDDTQQKLGFLEAELFRAQLENESNIRSEHAWTRQALEERDSRINAEAAANMLQSRAMLQQSAALRREEQHATAERVGDTTAGDDPPLNSTMKRFLDDEQSWSTLYMLPGSKSSFERAFDRALNAPSSSPTQEGKSVRFEAVGSNQGPTARHWVWDEVSNYRLRESDLLLFLRKKFGSYDFDIRYSHDMYTFRAPRRLTQSEKMGELKKLRFDSDQSSETDDSEESSRASTESPPPSGQVPSVDNPRSYCSYEPCVRDGRSFDRKSDLRRHIIATHGRADAITWDCEFHSCHRRGGYGFVRKDKMIEHMRDVHKSHRRR